MKPIASLDSRTELFVDDWLIESMQGVYLKLHPPERKEIVLDFDRPWEGNTSTYFTVIQEPDKIRLYYRGTLDLQKKRYAACYAESVDGVHFTRPDLQLHEFAGSRSNNIIWLDEGKRNIAHNLAPFLDPSPAALPEERYKAVGGSPSDRQELEDGIVKGGLHALVSCDGIHWRLKQEKEIMREGNGGQFDTLNTVLWDPIRSSYRSFSRFMREGARDIHTATSPDFLQWSEREPVRYSDIQPLQHYYTNSVILCPEAEHLYLAFPMRLVTDRKKLADHPYKGVSDTVFMTSRDGLNWDRTFREAWIRPGPDPDNWGERSGIVAKGCAELQSGEWSFYIQEHYRRACTRLRRLTIRKHGFGSVHAGYEIGEFETRPFLFQGSEFILNYSTSAVGFIQAELLDEQGQPLDGFAFGDMEPLYGDELAKALSWKGCDSVRVWEGKPVRLRFRMKEADLFSMKGQ